MAKLTVSGPLAASPSRRTVLTGALSLASGMLAGTSAAQPQQGTARHAIAMHGEPALPAGFRHLAYVNPDAPKRGRVLQGVLGTFDNINPFIVKGLVAQGIRAPLVANNNVIAGYVVESLMARSHDEPFTLYGLVAQTVETDAARSYVTFHLNPAARFSDGKPLTPEDVLFSWQLLREKGRPNHRTYYAKATKAEAIGERAVRFDFGSGDDRELPLIFGLMPVLAKHAVDAEKFEAQSFTAPVGSGPYIVANVDPGRSVTLARDPNHWGRDLAVNRGFWNFDEIRFDYYRDATSFHEAFKKGLFDLRTETDPGRWQTMYDFPALRDGRVIKEAFASGLPKGSFFFVFNTRRSMFADVRVREAISLLFDFEWVNHSYYFDLYRRTGSYFDGSELSARGRRADARERALLEPFPGAVRADILDGTWSPPVSDGSGRDRTILRNALRLLADAGYDLRGGTLIEVKSGRPLSFEIVIVTRNESIDEERLALQFSANLKRAGITAVVRRVDAVQFEARRLSFDFDMIQTRWDQSLSPGNEQVFYWSSAAADSNGSRNYMGVKSAALDGLIDTLLKAQERAEVVAAVRAIDRVLLSGFYAVPLFHLPEHWMARWSYIHHPAKPPLFGAVPETWWRQG
jgi:peptide/nickel transport system substrate-binding protein